jgi:uncharacterized protein YecE (DUF72 family)
MVMGMVKYGACSWKFPSWEQLVYQQAHSENYLAEYALHYDMVEIDQWFWSPGYDSAGLPDKKTVSAYDTSTPDHFQFTIKCPNALTWYAHPKKDGESLRINRFFLDSDLMRSFVDRLKQLTPKIGLLMFQFGYLNRHMFPSQQAFLKRLEPFLDALDPNIPYGIEIRNPQYLNGTWFSFLQERNIAPVLIQGYWMDNIVQTIHRYEQLIGDTVSIRLHGEDRQEIEEETAQKWNTLIHPKDRELAQVAHTIAHLADGGRLVYVQVNNHYEGSAPLTIKRLQDLMATTAPPSSDADQKF